MQITQALKQLQTGGKISFLKEERLLDEEFGYIASLMMHQGHEVLGTPVAICAALMGIGWEGAVRKIPEEELHTVLAMMYQTAKSVQDSCPAIRELGEVVAKAADESHARRQAAKLMKSETKGSA